jgi:four helix bundle protein
MYGLTSQIKRAAVSIPANIAEGCYASSNPGLKRCLFVSMGSAGELDYLFQLAHELKYLSDAEYQELNDLLVQVMKMLYSFINTVAASC